MFKKPYLYKLYRILTIFAITLLIIGLNLIFDLYKELARALLPSELFIIIIFIYSLITFTYFIYNTQKENEVFKLSKILSISNIIIGILSIITGLLILFTAEIHTFMFYFVTVFLPIYGLLKINYAIKIFKTKKTERIKFKKRKPLMVFLILILSIIIAVIIKIFLMYQIYKIDKSKHFLPAYFDFFIVETFYGGYEKNQQKEENSKKEMPIEWIINKNSFEKLDSVYVGFKNSSNEKLYYHTWGSPNSRLRQDLIIYKDGKQNLIPFGGFGCGTGVYFLPVKSKEIVGEKFLNPLMFNPYSNYDLPLDKKTFPKVFKEIYGDSVAIRFRHLTYSVPWNKYRSDYINSNYITISTDTIIENWKKGNFAHLPKTEPTLEESFGLKEMRKH